MNYSDLFDPDKQVEARQYFESKLNTHPDRLEALSFIGSCWVQRPGDEPDRADWTSERDGLRYIVVRRTPADLEKSVLQIMKEEFSEVNAIVDRDIEAFRRELSEKRSQSGP